jgi:MYXO-CTERM domain-containing protein
MGEGGSCRNNPYTCSVGTICLAAEGSSALCFARCDEAAFTCASDQACETGASEDFRYCSPVHANLVPIDDDRPESDLLTCDPARGNLDCPNEMGCVNRPAFGDARCANGARGDVLLGGLCKGDDDCSSGLCDQGVCTSSCEEGCPASFTCDAAAISGGLCVAEACEEGTDVCGADRACVESSTGTLVCALRDPSIFDLLGCACTTSHSRTGALAGFGLAGLLGALTLRRRPGGRQRSHARGVRA